MEIQGGCNCPLRSLAALRTFMPRCGFKTWDESISCSIPGLLNLLYSLYKYPDPDGEGRKNTHPCRGQSTPFPCLAGPYETPSVVVSYCLDLETIEKLCCWFIYIVRENSFISHWSEGSCVTSVSQDIWNWQQGICDDYGI